MKNLKLLFYSCKRHRSSCFAIPLRFRGIGTFLALCKHRQALPEHPFQIPWMQARQSGPLKREYLRACAEATAYRSGGPVGTPSPPRHVVTSNPATLRVMLALFKKSSSSSTSRIGKAGAISGFIKRTAFFSRYATGNKTVALVPFPTVDSRISSPPWSLTMLNEIARPRPVPP